MREIVIVIADLYLARGQTDLPPGAGAIGTLPGLEHAVRFGRLRSIEGEGGWRPWLARWLGRDDLAAIAPAVIAAAANADASPAPDGAAWIATPVHLITGLTSLHLDRRSLLRLPAPDLESFATDFNRTFAGSDLLLSPLPSGDFLLQGPATLTGSTTEPARALVADLEASLPKGTNAKPLKRLGAELEMWLHATPLNETRQRRGDLPVSTLWLWGGGPNAMSGARLSPHAGTSPGSSPNTTSQSAAATPSAEPATAATNAAHSPHAQTNLAFGTDPYLAGLTHILGIPTRAVPDQLNSILDDDRGARRAVLGNDPHARRAVLGNDPHAQRAVLVAEVTPLLQSNPRWSLFEALAELDRRLVSPALNALRGGTLESVILIANDTELRVRRHDRLKLWRRPQSAVTGLHS